MSKPHNVSPPKWPLKFLRFFIRKEYLEEIEGDMEELFYDNAAQLSYQKAKQIYVWEMFRLLRPVLMKNPEFIHNLNQAAMFKNYFKISFRGLMKNPLNSFINVFGLAAAIGFCIFSYAFAMWTYNTDQFHEHKQEIFLTTFSAERDGQPQRYGTTPRPLGEMMRQEFAHIKNVCRIEDKSVIMKYEDNVFHERIRFTDPEFLEMFSFPLKWGTAASVKDLNSIILSEKMSVKYFGDDNPIGQTILMIFDNDRTKAFTIAGVAKEFPTSRSFAFEFLVNFENLRTYDPAYNFHEWKAFTDATFIQLNNASDIKSIEHGMDKYLKLQNEVVQPEWAITSFAFEPLATLHEKTEDIKDDIVKSSHNNYISVIFMSALGGLLLALGCLNYINIAIASAAKRLKEIGVRKSIGATRSVVIVQFLSENLLITSFALILGLILGMTFFIPGFELLWKFNMDFRLNEPTLWIFLPLVLLLTSIVSGIYPSLYISRFQVVKILKGNVKFGQRNPVTKIFLGFQLILCCMFIICSVLFTQNTNYLSERSWGYNQNNAMYVRVQDRSVFEKLIAVMEQNPDVQLIAGSTHHVGKSHATLIIHFPARDFEVDRLAVDARYLQGLGVSLMAGRHFTDHEGSDRHAVIVNESFVTNLSNTQPGWENPIGKTFEIDSVEHQVVGVVKDFHNYNFDKLVTPIIFTVAQKDDFRYLSLKVSPGSEIKTYKALQAGWTALFPEIPFDGGLQRDVWGFYYEALGIYSLVWWVLAFIAVSLATLGLYGLIRLNIAGRTKEFSIRKVLGAGMKNITASITRQYAPLFVVALLIGAPAGFIFSKWLIEFSSVYHKPTSFSGAALGVAIMVGVILLTISTQIRQVIKSDPVKGLKTE
jgi:ABC-type antimicrobial peptide transport system permease subunit